MQTELLDYCVKNKIHYQAYSSLGTTVEGDCNPLLNDEVVQEIAKNYSKSPAQILLRWATQQEIGIMIRHSHWLQSLNLYKTCVQE